MKVYISLSISGKRHRQAARARRPHEGGSEPCGHKPVNPFENYCGDNPTYADYLCYDLRILADCDAIMLCDGWQFSRGCRIERMFAEEFGKHIMYESQPNAAGNYYFNR